MTTAAVKRDAKDRSWRTFLTGIGVDAGFALAFVVYSIASTDAPAWGSLIPLAIKSVAMAAASYVLRLKVAPVKTR